MFAPRYDPSTSSDGEVHESPRAYAPSWGEGGTGVTPASRSGGWRCQHGGVASRILVIEDDDRIRETTRLVLEDEGYDVVEAASAEDGLIRYDQRLPGCVIVDLMLPGMNGFECCRALRHRSDVPIVVLTARTDTHDVVAGLEAGADDYVTKPFHAKELTARIRALLRRAAGGQLPTVITLGQVEIRPDEGEVRNRGEQVALTKTEFRLLCELAAHPGRVFSREVLLESVWGYPQVGDGKLVDTHIHRLRLKLEDDPAHPQHVITVRGLGYKVNP
jgi:two-component system, OmpR family, response regulator MtrA